MITIVRGKGAAAAASDAGAGRLRLDGTRLDGAGWAGLRGIAASASRALGGARWEAALAPRRGVLSLAVPEITPSLTAGETEARVRASGLPFGDLPNAVIRDGAIYRAWGSTLAELLAGERVTILVPELDGIDLESLQALRVVVGSARGKAEVAVVIGHDTSRTYDDPCEAFLRARRIRQLSLLEALVDTQVVHRDGGEAIPPAPRSPSSLDALREAFASFAFEPAVRVAAALLDAGSTASDADVRDALRFGGLALYNLAALSRDEWSSAALRERFTRLLALETDALARAHCQYRLAMIHARGRGDLDAARAAADAAVAESVRGAGDPRAPLFAGWAHNARAYVRMRAGDGQGAAEDTEAGYAALAKPARGISGVEIEITRLLVANNRARVALSTGDADGLATWNAIRKKHYDALPADDRPGAAWSPPPEDDRDLATMRDYHASLLAWARQALDPESEAIAAHGLGVALYKLGDAKGAHDAFATSLRIWTITRGFAEDLLTEELNCAVTAFRCGETSRAEEGFARVRASSLMQNDAAQAETLAALAMIDARAKNPRSVSRADEAVAAAEATGEPDVLVRTLRSAAEARFMAGDHGAALALARRALAVVDATETGGGELPPEDVLGVLVTALDASPSPDPALLRRAVALAPNATNDANAWWDVPRLDAHARGVLDDDEDLAGALAAIARIVGQRAAK